MKQTGKKLLSYLLILAMVVGLVPGMRLTAYADLSITIDPAGAGSVQQTYNEMTELYLCEAIAAEGYTFQKWTYTIDDEPEESTKFNQFFYEEAHSNIVAHFVPATVAVSGVSLDPATLSLTVGDDPATLTATVSPDGATDKTVTWTTSDASIATVADGVVTAQGAGTATITATATNGTEDTSDDKTATCAVTVSAAQATLEDAQSALETSIIEANAYAVSIVESHENEAVTVSNSVQTATEVRNNDNATAEELQSAKETLDKVVAKTKLEISIEEAESYYNDIQGSHADAAATLLSAINTAKAVKDDTNATAQALTEAKTALDNALATAQAQAAAAPAMKTVQFLNTKNWSSVYAFAYNGDDKPDSWPGIQMTPVSTNADKQTLYTVSIRADMTVVIFNNGADMYTADISDLAANGTRGFYPGSNGNLQTIEEPATVAVTAVTLPATATVNENETVSLTATVQPDNATNKSVEWSISGDAAALYFDEDCTQPVGENATEALTVYVKGLKAGSATVTVLEAGGTHGGECAVTVNAAASTQPALTVGTTWYVGDAFNPGEVWINDLDGYAASLAHSSGAGSVSQPSIDGDSWYFENVCPIDRKSMNGEEYPAKKGAELALYFTMPEGKSETDVPTGFRIKSGSGSEGAPYTFELVYDEKPAPALAVGTTWYVGNAFNPGAVWFNDDDSYAASFYRCSGTGIVRQPISSGGNVWNFPDLCPMDKYSMNGSEGDVDEGIEATLYLTVPQGKSDEEKPTGFKIKSGDGTLANPYTFELVYDAPPAAETVTYTDGNGEHTCTVVDANTMVWTDGWYAVKEGETVNLPARVTVSGSVTLVLMDGATLNANGGISVPMGNSLTVEGDGTLNANASGVDGAAGIGGDAMNFGGDGGSITISGGSVYATGGYGAAGIGGASFGNGGSIAISGGSVYATGGFRGAGIGGGDGKDGGSITISGSATVTATGGYDGSGIGGGQNGTTGGSISISGEVSVTVTGGEHAMGFGNDSITVAEGLAVTAGSDAASAAAVSDFATNHGQRYVHIEAAPAPAAVATVDGTSYSSFAEALSAWAGGAGTTLTLAGDVTVDSAISISGTKTLDLNGYGIKMTGNDCVINIPSGASLTLNDSNPARTDTGDNRPAGVTGGYLTGGTGTDQQGDKYGGAVFNKGAFTMNGGSITGNHAKNGGGVFNGGAFTMNGGSITGNNATNRGGGVYNNPQTVMTMNGGSITGNTANYFGGGMSNAAATVTLNGGSIIGNSAPRGGGVGNLSGTFTMSGGSITSNTATDRGGGVQNDYMSVMTMTGGSITGNTAPIGGGVMNAGGTVNLGGAPVITGNTGGDLANVSGSSVVVTGALTEGAAIGATLYDNDAVPTSGTFAQGGNYTLTDDDAAKFTSDLSDYIVKRDGNTLLLGIAHTHSFSYSLNPSGDTVTATCTADGCTDPALSAALTITAPTLTTYGGTGDAAATLTGLDAFNTATEKTVSAADILYVGRNDTAYTESATAPTAAGQYTAKLTVEGQTATVDYEISKAAAPAAESLTDAQKPAAKAELIADGSEQPLVTAPTLPEGYTKVQYSLDGETWTDEIPTGKDPGDYSVQVKYVGDKNHSDFEGETVNITIGSLTVSFADSDVAAQSVIRNGKLERPANPSREGYAFDGWFEDATCTVPYDFNKTVTGNVTLYAKWTPNVYQLTAVTGATTDANHIWYKQSGTDTVTNNNTGVEVTVKLTNGPDDSFNHFTGVQLDGVTLTRDVDYSVREGSTVVTLFPATLRRLANGAHTLTVLFDNNSVSTRLTVRQNSSTPATGDESNTALYLTILVLSALGMAAVTVESKKRRSAKR